MLLAGTNYAPRQFTFTFALSFTSYISTATNVLTYWRIGGMVNACVLLSYVNPPFRHWRIVNHKKRFYPPTSCFSLAFTFRAFLINNVSAS